MNNHSSTEKANMLRTMQFIVFAGSILYFGRTILIPLGFSLLIAFLVYPVCSWLEKKRFSKMAASMTSVSIVVLFGASLLALLITLFLRFAAQWRELKEKLFSAVQDMTDNMARFFSVSEEQLDTWLQNIIDDSSSHLLPFLRYTFYESGVGLVLAVLIPIFSVLILYYRRMLTEVLYLIFPSESQESIINILRLSITAYYNFIKGMVIVYLVVGARHCKIRY